MSVKTLIIATTALVVGGVVAAPALAAPPGAADGLPMRATVMFNLLDRNGDGVVDTDEASAVTDAIFQSLDSDSDGKLTEDELDKVRKAIGPRGGRPGPAAYQGRPNARGPMWNQGRGGRPQAMRQGMMGPGPGQGMMGPGPRRLDFATIDSNGDGNISQEEFAAAHQLRWNQPAQ